MKTFKLKKEYPGSPKLNTVVTQFKQASYVYYNNDKTCLIYNPQNHPDFWEKFEHLGFKVLIIIDELGVIAYPQRDGNFSNVAPNTLEHGHRALKELLYSGFSIEAVERLSDGEVFSLGDNIICGDEGEITAIKKIKIINDKVYIDTQYSKEYPLYVVIKCRKPLFKTTDGVYIYKGDKYYWISTLNSEVVLHTTADIGSGENEERLYFSSKEAAKEHSFRMNLSFSYDDIVKYLNFSKEALKNLLDSKR